MCRLGSSPAHNYSGSSVLNEQIVLVEKLLTAGKKTVSCGSRSVDESPHVCPAFIWFELGLWFCAECVCTGRPGTHTSHVMNAPLSECSTCAARYETKKTAIVNFNVFYKIERNCTTPSTQGGRERR